MAWHTTHDLDAFENATAAFVRADPVRNILLANIPGRLRQRGLDFYGDEPPRFGWFVRDGRIAAVLVQTPPFPVLVSALPTEAVEPFVDLVLASGGVMSGIHAPVATATAVAAGWSLRTGRVPEVEKHTRLFRLGTLVPPDPMPEGSARVATADDRGLLVHWYELFNAQTTGPRLVDVDKAVDDALRRGSLLLWEAGGEPVSFAGNATVGADATSIGPVFTPEDRRRHGYAAAVTAEAGRRAAAGGGEVVLFTDVLNATSNGVYRRIGFVPVEDRQIIAFPG